MESSRDVEIQNVLKSPCFKVSTPEISLLHRILTSLKEHATRNPDQPAVIDAFHVERFLTHKQIYIGALSFASFLGSRGVSAGDRVTIALPNSIEWPVLHLGTWAAGAAVIGSSTAFKVESVYQWQDSGCSVIIVAEEMIDSVVTSAKECPALKTIICVRSTTNPLPEGVFDYEETLKFPPIEKIAEVSLDSLSLVAYSSGTTSLPKRVMHTHRTLHCAVEMLRSHFLHAVQPVLGGVESSSSQILATSCMHIFGFATLNWFLIAVSLSGPIVLMRSFDGEVYLEVIDKFKPRFLLLTPPMFAYLAKDPKAMEAALDSVQMICCAASSLRQQLSDEFRIAHPNVKYIVQGYGMTETVASHLPLLLEEGVNASVGVVASCYEQKIIDPTSSQPCKIGQWGEVWVRGACQTIGYLNKLEATKELIDNDGWLHTGDVGYLDSRGFLHFFDRMTEIIHVNFKNQTAMVSPSEVEGVLLSSPKIKDAAVVGIQDIKGGELVRAFVVKNDGSLTDKEVMELVAVNLSEEKRITAGVFFLDELPRTSAIGKIKKQSLREMVVAWPNK